MGMHFAKTHEVLIPLFILMFVVLMKHQANIKRLLQGTEDKVKF